MLKKTGNNLWTYFDRYRMHSDDAAYFDSCVGPAFRGKLRKTFYQCSQIDGLIKTNRLFLDLV